LGSGAPAVDDSVREKRERIARQITEAPMKATLRFRKGGRVEYFDFGARAYVGTDVFAVTLIFPGQGCNVAEIRFDTRFSGTVRMDVHPLTHDEIAEEVRRRLRQFLSTAR
jgi:hypothetical protein